jgi:carboxypeptidase Q
MKNFAHFLRFHRIPLLLFIVISTLSISLEAQTARAVADSVFIRHVYEQSLRDGRSYPWLEQLTQKIGHRLSGSPQAAKAVLWGRSILDTLGLDSVWLQPVMVPHWVRGPKEQVWILGANGRRQTPLNALALGGSVGTPATGLRAEVVEVRSWEQLEQLGEAGIKGRIVFYNRPMDPAHINTFDAYRGAVDQRSQGASKAARFGALAVLVRSVGLSTDDFPHTGGMRYDSSHPLIPAAAISTLAADRLAESLKNGKKVRIWIKMQCKTLPDVPSFNVIGEIRGAERPNEIILTGGHLDSWDVGEGAHDDGAGCVQSMEVLRLLKNSGYRPRHTLRCVLFMNEENGLRGGRMYAREAERKQEFHLCAIESDAGGFTPRGFSFEAENSVFQHFFQQIRPLEPFFGDYGLRLIQGGSGADIGPLRPQKGLLSGYMPDSQRYFDLHHTAADVLEKVHRRELELGAGSIAALVYLLDKYLEK